MSLPPHVDPPSATTGRAGLDVPPMKGGGEMGRRVRDTDWSTTPLGAYATWPQSLRSSLSLVLNAKGIAALYWGPDQWLLYNDAYGVALGDRHPDAFGHPMPDVLTDIAPVLGPQVAEVLRTGEGFAIENLSMVMRRHDRDEETVWTYSFSPVQGETGDFAGVLLLATEMTEQKAAERSEARIQTRLETTLRVARLGTFDWQPSTGAIEVDARGREMFGLPAEGTLTQIDTFGRIAREDVDRVQRGAAEVMGIDQPFDACHLGRTIDFDYDVVRADGSRRSIVSSGTIMVDADGVRRMVGAFNDVTELKRAEAQLREQNASLERSVQERTQDRNVIWQVSRELLVVTDDRGRLLRVNPAWTRVLGWDEAHLLGRTTEWLEHPDDRAKTRDVTARLAEHGVDMTVENRIRAVDGSYRTLAWTAVPLNGQFYCSGRDVTDEVERAEVLRRSQMRAALYFDFSQDYLFLVEIGADGSIRFEAMNPACAAAMGLTADVVGRPIEDLLPADSAADVARFARLCLETGRSQRYLAVREYRAGHHVVIEGRVTPVEGLGADGLVMFSGTDVTEQRRTEDALRQSQKMEAVGQLTGGLAHDFNNLLTGISGSLDLLQRRVAQGRIDDLDRYLLAAQGASKRAAALTHRLLAFSRRQTLDPKPTDVSRLILGMVDLIRRTVGPEITVETVDMVGLWTALVDQSQLENAVLNLAINARDAMPDGGRITIETANKWMDDRAARERGVLPGQYLSVSVSDTGAGMPPEVIARAFEPFFTTKPLGQGTGLGLSMIYGFAQQSGGQVRIYSEPGQGTTVSIYLPRRYGDGEHPDHGGGSIGEAPRALMGETVLVVDDEPTIRMLVTDVLSDFGYAAIEAEDGPSGLKALADAGRVDLLVTDVGLPGGMNGRQVADAARALRPGLKVLFITGYAENAAVGNGHLEPGMAVLTKPFAMDELAAKIRVLIEG